MGVPKSAFEVRREANSPAVINRVLGYRQRQLLIFARLYAERFGISPSYSIIGDELDGASKADIGKIVKRLERRGLVVRRGSGREPRLVLVSIS